MARLSQAKSDLNETFSRKRAAASQEAEAAKRQKMERLDAMHGATSSTSIPSQHPPVATSILDSMQPIHLGSITYAKLYTLATDPALVSFDGQQLPLDLVLQIVVGSMYSVDQKHFDTAIAVSLVFLESLLENVILTFIKAVRARYNVNVVNPRTSRCSPEPISKLPTAHELHTAVTAYSLPVSIPTAQTELPEGLTVVKYDKKENDEDDDKEIQLQLSEFRLSPPPRLSTQQSQRVSLEAMDRMFGVIDAFETKSLISRKSKLGVNRLAASNWDREGWIALLIRMATRGSQDNDVATADNPQPICLADAVRERLYTYIIEDFRRRMDVAVAWLNEEWYNDMVMDRSKVGVSRHPQYHKWMMKVIDSIFPFLEARDRLFMRMLSEIPEIPTELLHKVKMLCLDPDRATLGIQMLQ